MLFLDKCNNIHWEYNPSNVNYFYFEPNTSSELQPFDLTVFKAFK